MNSHRKGKKFMEWKKDEFDQVLENELEMIALS